MAPSVSSRVVGRARGVVCPSVALLLAACATPGGAEVTPRHVAPTEGPSARLVMRATVTAGEAYSMTVFDDVEHCAGPRTLGVGNVDRHPVTTALAAGRVQTLEFFLVKSSRQYCTIRLSFEPQAGRTYLLAGNSVRGGCETRVLDMTDPDDMKPDTSARRRDPGAEACVPLAASKPVIGTVTQGVPTTDDAVLRRGKSADDLRGLMNP